MGRLMWLSLKWLSGPMLCLVMLHGPAMGAETAAPGNAPRISDRQAAGQSPDQATPDEQDSIDEHAMDILNRMADALAQAQRFSVTIEGRYDVVQPDSGEKIEFGERRTVLLNRPDGLRAEALLSDGKRRLVIFDGKTISVFDPDEKVYGQVEAAGGIDGAVRHLVQDLQVRLPLALLLVSTLPDELHRRLVGLDFVERDVLTLVPANHLAGRTEDVDFQVWVAADGPPLPQRITITYKSDEGEPQYRADLTDWNLNPAVSPAQFAFTPPEGTERIPFMIRVRRTAAGQSATPNDPAHATPGQASPESSGRTEGRPQ